MKPNPEILFGNIFDDVIAKLIQNNTAIEYDAQAFWVVLEISTELFNSNKCLYLSKYTKCSANILVVIS